LPPSRKPWREEIGALSPSRSLIDQLQRPVVAAEDKPLPTVTVSDPPAPEQAPPLDVTVGKRPQKRMKK